jgi:hypothetical protein
MAFSLREALALWKADNGPVDKETREWARKELMRAWGEISSLTPAR